MDITLRIIKKDTGLERVLHERVQNVYCQSANPQHLFIVIQAPLNSWCQGHQTSHAYKDKLLMGQKIFSGYDAREL